MPKRFLRILLAPLLAAGLFAARGGAAPPAAPPASPLAVHVLDVGHGDAIVILTPGGRCVLIDAGGGRRGGGAVLSLLKEKRVRRLDTVVMSHADSDHIGGMPAVLSSGIEVGEFLDPGYPHTTTLYRRVLEAVQARPETRYRTPRAGELLDWGKELQVRVLAPGDDPRGTNDSSIVIRLTYGTVSFLFTGDAGRRSEREMARRFGTGLRAQVLKAGHHGSKSSSTAPFLKLVKPEVAIVSTRGAGPDDPYRETTARLRAAGSKIYQTGRYGMVTVYSDGAGYRVVTEREVEPAEAEVRETAAATGAAAPPRELPASTAAVAH